MKKFAIAVDGPAGSGKSTVAKAVAKKLGIIYVDTGAMYRAVAYFCIQKGVSTLDEKGVLPLLTEIRLEIQPQRGGQRIFLDGEDITDSIRTQEIGQGASHVGTIQSVRQKLGDMQREMAKNYSVIMDGRDIGTYVLPEAEVKIYMDAGADERARRRMGELKAKGEKPVFEMVREEIIKRDENDMNRKCRPLRKAEDAVYLDTTAMSIDEVVEEILEITKIRIGEV
ncbi:(d)CMP kinase [Anaerotignum sp. MB30-C6]|uniref:(d)CMP kinase n=1 Tax=Anaerotignum sp. MB30-C6 TaxID=3070814 RepID=UPI0027DD853C|nr:(d)CMP kinase [Anaerotignum sp. MB30-C6]WMI81675.1 (d)CMP kinase [Anaerotignum sp. MB30-C6]